MKLTHDNVLAAAVVAATAALHAQAPTTCFYPPSSVTEFVNLDKDWDSWEQVLRVLGHRPVPQPGQQIAYVHGDLYVFFGPYEDDVAMRQDLVLLCRYVDAIRAKNGDYFRSSVFLVGLEATTAAAAIEAARTAKESAVTVADRLTDLQRLLIERAAADRPRDDQADEAIDELWRQVLRVEEGVALESDDYRALCELLGRDMLAPVASAAACDAWSAGAPASSQQLYGVRSCLRAAAAQAELNGERGRPYEQLADEMTARIGSPDRCDARLLAARVGHARLRAQSGPGLPAVVGKLTPAQIEQIAHRYRDRPDIADAARELARQPSEPVRVHADEIGPRSGLVRSMANALIGTCKQTATDSDEALVAAGVRALIGHAPTRARIEALEERVNGAPTEDLGADEIEGLWQALVGTFGTATARRLLAAGQDLDGTVDTTQARAVFAAAGAEDAARARTAKARVALARAGARALSEWSERGTTSAESSLLHAAAKQVLDAAGSDSAARLGERLTESGAESAAMTSEAVRALVDGIAAELGNADGADEASSGKGDGDAEAGAEGDGKQQGKRDGQATTGKEGQQNGKDGQPNGTGTSTSKTTDGDGEQGGAENEDGGDGGNGGSKSDGFLPGDAALFEFLAKMFAKALGVEALAKQLLKVLYALAPEAFHAMADALSALHAKLVTASLADAVGDLDRLVSEITSVLDRLDIAVDEFFEQGFDRLTQEFEGLTLDKVGQEAAERLAARLGITVEQASDAWSALTGGIDPFDLAGACGKLAESAVRGAAESELRKHGLGAIADCVRDGRFEDVPGALGEEVETRGRDLIERHTGVRLSDIGDPAKRVDAVRRRLVDGLANADPSLGADLLMQRGQQLADSVRKRVHEAGVRGNKLVRQLGNEVGAVAQLPQRLEQDAFHRAVERGGEFAVEAVERAREQGGLLEMKAKAYAERIGDRVATLAMMRADYGRAAERLLQLTGSELDRLVDNEWLDRETRELLRAKKTTQEQIEQRLQAHFARLASVADDASEHVRDAAETVANASADDLVRALEAWRNRRIVGANPEVSPEFVDELMSGSAAALAREARRQGVRALAAEMQVELTADLDLADTSKVADAIVAAAEVRGGVGLDPALVAKLRKGEAVGIEELREAARTLVANGKLDELSDIGEHAATLRTFANSKAPSELGDLIRDVFAKAKPKDSTAVDLNEIQAMKRHVAKMRGVMDRLGR